MNIEDYACSAPPTSNLPSLEKCMCEIEMPAPIDFYFEKSRDILQYGTNDRLNDFNSLGGLLLLGLISSAECYFRSILSATLDICPISKSTAAEKQINLGGVLWHGNDNFRRSAFEHMSFASGKEIVSAAKNYLNFDMKGNVFKEVLNDYDTICHLRHGLIHNAGVLPGRNAIQINIKSYSKPIEICIDFSFLQDAAASIDSLIATFNRALFFELCGRWAGSWRNRTDWEPSEAKQRFTSIWNTFICKHELKNRPGRSKIKLSRCMEKVQSHYNI